MAGDFGQHNYISESLFYKQPLLNTELSPSLPTAGFKSLLNGLLKKVVFFFFNLEFSPIHTLLKSSFCRRFLFCFVFYKNKK